uniref:SAND domain-containing protein n=1 Tax=Ascaris lumbricoides TaxID=6252 RepID=A0A9J2PKB4_ASCLU
MGEHTILRGLLVSGRKTRCARVEGTERCAVFDVRCVRAEGRLGVLPLEPAAAVTNRWTREHSSWEMSVADSEEVRSATPPEDLNVPILEVKCGQLVARLHMEKFVCPGIHQPCIELDGELISPKEFTIRANKDKQKDWKGSIRIGKSNMRALMEMKSLNFYNHDTYCSAKCQSRNYITSKNFPNDVPFNQDSLHGASASNNFDTNESIAPTSTVVSSTLQHFVAHTANTPAAFASLGFVAKDPTMLSSLFSTNGVRQSEVSPKQEETTDRGSYSAVNISRAMQNRIMDDIMEMILNSFDQTRRLANMGAAQRDVVAERLTRIVCALDLEETVGTRIHAERLQCAVESNLLSNEIQAELQRKAEERRRKLEEARRRAARFDELLSGTLSPPSKRARNFASDDSSAPPILQ